MFQMPNFKKMSDPECFQKKLIVSYCPTNDVDFFEMNFEDIRYKCKVTEKFCTQLRQGMKRSLALGEMQFEMVMSKMDLM